MSANKIPEEFSKIEETINEEFMFNKKYSQSAKERLNHIEQQIDSAAKDYNIVTEIISKRGSKLAIYATIAILAFQTGRDKENQYHFNLTDEGKTHTILVNQISALEKKDQNLPVIIPATGKRNIADLLHTKKGELKKIEETSEYQLYKKRENKSGNKFVLYFMLGTLAFYGIKLYGELAEEKTDKIAESLRTQAKEKYANYTNNYRTRFTRHNI